jgi:hypothetical protein
MRNAKVVGVHPVEADQPCHLIELTICDPDGEFNVDDLTQVDETVEKGLWQAACDERFLDARSLEPLPQRLDHRGIVFDPGVSLEPPDRKEYRLAFFFHYLDLAKPMESSFGPLALPEPSPRPEHLAFMDWGPP